MGFLSNLSKKFSSTGRRLERKEKSFKKAQAKAQIADIESQLEFNVKEDPREQSQLRQSMFGRGLGKSTINTQGMARLTDIQARRRAALLRNKDLAHRGLSLIKLRARAARRFAPYDIADDLLEGTATVASLGLLGGGEEAPPKGSSYSYEWSGA